MRTYGKPGGEPSLQLLAYSIPQTVKMTGVGRSTIYAAIKSGELESLKVGARRLVPDDALRAWLATKRAQ